MNAENIEFRSISSLMLQRITALALVCLIGVGGVQVWWERQKQEAQFFETMALIVETSSSAVGHALWDIDRDVLLNHLQRLAEIDAVGFVRIHTLTTGEVLTAGRSDPEQDVPSYQAVIYAPDNKSQRLGSIEVWADPVYHRNLLWESQKHVIPGYLVFTILLCITVAWVIRRDLGIPLRQIANYVGNLKPEALNQPLEIQRTDRTRADEIDMVLKGFHHLQGALDRHIKDLDGLVKERTKELSALVDEVKRLSQTDVLTGAFNRRAMELRLPSEMERCQRYERSLSLIFLDIDHFKRINDQHGHAAGDKVLKEVAHRLQNALRVHVDWLVRFGGEEFVVFMPETDLVQATEVAQRLVDVVRREPWKEDRLVLPLTCSLGVTQLRRTDSVDSLLQRADSLLYQAKNEGRDRVCVAA